MMRALSRKPHRFPELSYADANDRRLKRWFIHSVPYDIWRSQIVPTRERVFGRMLELVDVSLRCRGAWPPQPLPDGPLVIVANHPFGIGDGIAVLSLAESLGRPFRVLIHKGLLKIPEMEPYSLPIDFDETKEAMRNNLAVRQEALRLVKEGVTIVVFPAGAVATAPNGFGRAEDLPWKMFPAWLVQEAKASVIPVHFTGQNGRLFHLVSGPMGLLERDNRIARSAGDVSLTLRTSLLIGEFTRLSGRAINVHVGRTLSWNELAAIHDRKSLTAFLHQGVFSLAPEGRPRRRVRVRPLPGSRFGFA